MRAREQCACVTCEISVAHGHQPAARRVYLHVAELPVATILPPDARAREISRIIGFSRSGDDHALPHCRGLLACNTGYMSVYFGLWREAEDGGKLRK